MRRLRASIRRYGSAETGLFALALVTITAMMAVIAVCAAWVDRSTLQTEQALVAHGLAARQSELLALVRPQVVWDEAVTHLTDRFDPAWAHDNIVNDLNTRVGFSLGAIVDAADRPLTTWNGQGRPDPVMFAATRGAWAPLIAAVRRREASQAALPIARHLYNVNQASGVYLVSGRPHIFTATLVQPDYGKVGDLPPRSAIVLAAAPLGGAFVAAFAERYQLADAGIAPVGTPTPAGMARVAITDAAGAPVGQFQWRPHRPGSALLGDCLPYGLVLLPLLMLSLVLTYRSVRRAMAKIRIARDEADRANQAKGEFLAAVSHEIRTPLNGVIGALHILLKEPLTAEGRRLAANAVDCGEMVVALINDVLDFNQITTGEMGLNAQPTDLQALFEAACGAFAPACEAKGLRLVTHIQPGLDWALVDGLRLRQCLHNLIGNAVKFTAQGEIVVRAFRPANGAHRLRIEVRDTGIGVPEADHETIFDRFKQGDGSTTRRYGGTGLGLAITRSLARAMGGEVGLESREGRGSRFHIEIDAPPVEAESQASGPDAEIALLKGVSVLLVDDNLSNLMIAETLLRQFGAEVETVTSGQAAIDACAARAPDLVLMDIQMPEMDGLEAMRRIRALGGVLAETPILALTANALADERARYLAAGMVDVVAKPISPLTFLTALNGALNAAAEAAETAEPQQARA